MNPQQILEAARKAIEAGESPDDVARWIQTATGMTIEQLAAQVQAPAPPAPPPFSMDASTLGRGAAATALATAARGALSGLGTGALPGLLTAPGTGRLAGRAAASVLRSGVPVPSLAARVAPRLGAAARGGAGFLGRNWLPIAGAGTLLKLVRDMKAMSEALNRR